jgi:SAM-dependent methyltransferase
VVFDLPNVVSITRRYIDAAGLSARVSTTVGDYLADPMPAGFDLVFLSAVVHSNNAAQNASLIASCARALNPGGTVAVVDWVMSPDRVSPAAGAMFALNMLVGTDEGDTYTEDEIRGWLADAGLTRVERRATPFGTDIMLGGRGLETHA